MNNKGNKFDEILEFLDVVSSTKAGIVEFNDEG